ncbi:MAG: ATP-binding protein [Deltaproteobacteria bacterium]|nr:ATP-binding protein [Deltaproteobacteria bacterium]
MNQVNKFFWLVQIVGFSLYLFLFNFYFSEVKSSFAIISVIFVAVNGWYFRIRGGVLTSLALFIVHGILFSYHGLMGWEWVRVISYVTGSFAMVFIGFVIGKISELNLKYKLELKEKIKLSANLKKAKQEAEAASLAKSNFLSVMSHELRTPINGIIGMAELLLESDPTPQQKKDLETIKDSGKALVHIIGDILDLSRIETGKMEFDYVEFNLSKLLDETVDLFFASALFKKIRLVCNKFFDKDIYLVGESTRIRQILSNLMSNAIKFTSQGEVSLIAKVTETKDGLCLVRFEVKDTGIGIADEQKSLIFDYFTQADSSSTRKYGGTGLGLSVSQKLVQLMNGAIGFQSQKDQGSLFWVEFELQKSATKSPVKPVPLNGIIKETPTNDKKGHILVLEKTLSHQIGLKKTLYYLGYRSEVISSCNFSSPDLQINTYDLVLLDCDQPIGEVIKTVETIREKGETTGRQIPIIGLLNDNLPQQQEPFREVGINDFLNKPPREKETNDLIRKHLERTLS